MNKTIVLPMVDGGIIDISTSNDFSFGCPTCDFGSCYTNKFDIKMTQGTIRVTCEQMYEYPFQKDDDEDAESWGYGWGNAPWSEGDLMKIILLPQHEQSDIKDSLEVVSTLGVEYKIVNIGKTVDSIIEEMKKSGVTPTEQALVNVPARIRMAETYFYAQCVNGIPSCNCNLSEDWIGYSTYGGDGFGSFSPLGGLTVGEVKAIGRLLPIPQHLVEKVPSDGLCGKTDEDNLGFTYDVLDRYIRQGVCEDEATKKRIDYLHERNLFKLQLMPTFRP